MKFIIDENWKNKNGLYCCPKCNKEFEFKKQIAAHIVAHNTNNSNKFKKLECSYCSKKVVKHHFQKHELTCYLNPKNLRLCPVCNKPTKDKTATCSYACSNKYFRSGPNNGNWKEESYRSTCFFYHEKKCVVCGEEKIVDVHHYDENKKNNSPENLIPLCPTHHQYLHSKYKNKIIDSVDKYRNKFIETNNLKQIRGTIK